MRKVLLIIVSLMTMASIQVAAQKTIKVSGTVLEENGDAAIGASVMVKGSSIGVVTDVNGNFELEVPEENAVLTVSVIGFLNQNVTIGKQTSGLRIVLQEDRLLLDEVVVVGYGEQSRKSITSSVAKLGGDELKDIPITNVGEGLKGKIAGLRVTQNSFSPGGGFTYRVRGGSSINGDNSPLVLVDGVERDFSTMNPNDIASIEVLKDAASSAIYGARASNGVILVTTKKGSFGLKPRITFEATIAHQSPENLTEYLGAEDYIRVTRLAVADYMNNVPERATAARNYLNGATSAGTGNKPDGIYSTRYWDGVEPLPAGYKTMADPLDPSKTIMFCDTDWQSLIYKPAWWQNYYVGIDGGSEGVRYSASLGYNSDQGIAMSTGYDRLTFKGNMDAKISRKITANVGMEYSRNNTDSYANERNTIARALSSAPTMRVYYDNGEPVEGYNSTSQTPTFYSKYYVNGATGNRMTALGGIKWDIIDGLKAQVNGSFFLRDNPSNSFVKANINDASRETTQTVQKWERSKIEALLAYNHNFGKSHHFDATAGYSFQKYHYSNFTATGTGSVSDKLPTLASSAEYPNVSSSEQFINEMGFFGRANYSFKGRYLLTGTFRADASSKFAKGNQWGYFPGISAGWIVSEEPWFNAGKAITFLKPRVSYGSTGNNSSVGIYDAFGAYSAGNKYNSTAGVKPAEMPNLNLKWETSTQLDAGVEIGLLNNRIYISADYYNKLTHDLLYEQNLPNTTGFSKYWTNLGKVRFWGYELEITTHNIDRRDFSWDTKLVLSYNRNVVVSLPDNGIEKGRTGGIAFGDGTYFGGIAEGEPLYRIYGAVPEYILETQEQADAARYDNLSRLPLKGMKKIGDYEWKDRNGDGIVDTQGADQYCLGVTVPPFTGGISNTFRYKGLSLDIYLDWATGHVIYDENYERLFYSTFTMNYALAKDVLKCWQEPGDVTRYAKFGANDSGWGNDNFNRATSAVFTYKGDYLCIRDVTLRYNMPERLFKGGAIQGLQLTLSGNNLHYFSELRGHGISPEAGTKSTYDSSYHCYPPVRRISCGIKLTF